MAEKLFYSMGEVAEMFDVRRSLIRHWESQFSVLKPHRTARGNRMFTPQDVEHLKIIYHLVKERGMTLEGAKRAMKRHAAGGDSEMKREAELMTRLKHIRALLVEVREDLKSGGEGIIADEEPSAEPAVAAAPKPRRKKPVVKFESEEEPVVEALPAEPEPAPEVQVEQPVSVPEAPAETASAEPTPAAEEPQVEASVAEVPEPAVGAPQPKSRTTSARRSRRKPNDDDDKELFAFYEQSLF